jgi:hypothetical protein
MEGTAMGQAAALGIGSPTPSYTESIVGEGRYVAVSDLLLDGKNPRFPVDVDSTDQVRVATTLADTYDALGVAKSIAQEGFFAAEPPAVLDNKDGTFTVLEGNRRVTALKGLLDPGLSSGFADKQEWEAVVEEGRRGGLVPTAIPVIIYGSRSDADGLLINRHIKGPKKWEPFQQDRYVYDLVEQGKTFPEAAEMLYTTVGEVKASYRNYRLVAKDAPGLGIAISDDKAKYSVLSLVWNTNALRKHAHVAEKSEVRAGQSSIAPGSSDEEAKSGLAEVLLWVLGDRGNKVAPVLTDSRQVVKLGQVVSSEVGLEALRAGKPLKDALQRVSEEGAAPVDGARRMLIAATNSILNAKPLLEKLDEDEKATIVPLLSSLADALTSAQAALGSGGE